MPEIRVVNVRNTPYTPFDDGKMCNGRFVFYIGRVHTSGWRDNGLGNPFHGHGGKRWEVVRLYEVWLREVLEKAPDGPEARAIAMLRSKVESGINVDLLCWCAPKQCHGDVVKLFIEGKLP